MRQWSQNRRTAASTQKYKRAHPEKIRAYKKLYRSTHPELATVSNHYRFIFKQNIKAYRGMPFFDAWNPQQGGRLFAGAQWISENIGHRPSKTHHLHIVNRRLGFVPGNLQWVPQDQHCQEELIPKLLLEIQNLRNEIAILRKAQ